VRTHRDNEITQVTAGRVMSLVAGEYWLPANTELSFEIRAF
jgi:hypothetical protein